MLQTEHFYNFVDWWILVGIFFSIFRDINMNSTKDKIHIIAHMNSTKNDFPIDGLNDTQKCEFENWKILETMDYANIVICIAISIGK